MATSFLDANGLAHYHSAVKDLVNSKVSEPVTDGSNGDVLTTDGSGNRTWQSITAVTDYAYVAEAKTSAEKCEAYATAFQTAAYEIDDNGHLVITFDETSVTAAESEAEISTYAANAQTAADTVESCYNNLTNATLYLNSDGHLIVEYPS